MKFANFRSVEESNINIYVRLMCSRGGAVGTPAKLRDGLSGVRTSVGATDIQNVQTGSGTHQAPYEMSKGVPFHRGKAA
jgi:hypothetical protein